MKSESEIISWIRSRSKHGRRNPTVGIGDDAAVYQPREGYDLLVCSDLSVESVHFRTEWAEPRMIGYKCLAVTISDVAAMGGVPLYALLSAAIPAGKSDPFVEELFEGVFDAADRFEVALIGGDTSKSPGPIFLDTTVIGECPSGRAVTRSGARPGDLIFVTGSLGASAVGLRVLQDESAEMAAHGAPTAPSAPSAARAAAVRRHLMPEPRVEAGRAIGESRLATAMIDISDGLSTDLSHITTESGLGAVVYAEQLPIAESLVLANQSGFATDPVSVALSSGEEYELLFTARTDDRSKIEVLLESLRLPVTCIGEVTQEQGLQLSVNGRHSPIDPSGYQHIF